MGLASSLRLAVDRGCAVLCLLGLAEQQASQSNRFLLSRSVRRQKVWREGVTGSRLLVPRGDCFIEVDKD